MKTKICSIVLERLDEKQINPYLQTCGLKKRKKSVGSIKSAQRPTVSESIIDYDGVLKTKKNPKNNGSRKKNNWECSIKKSDLGRKKRKIKLSSNADDVSNRSVFDKEEPVAEFDETKKLRVISDFVGDRGKSHTRLKKTYENEGRLIMKHPEQTTSGFEAKKNMILKALLENSGLCRSENHGVSSPTVDTEIEIVKEHLNLKNNVQIINCDKTEARRKKGQLLVKCDSVQAERFEDEYDLREDNEDDKITVIFEEEFNEDRDSVIFDLNEMEIEREITNQKIRTLIQLRRECLKNRNSETRGKEPSIGQGATEIPALPIDVSEDCLKEICVLIQRLYKLYKIILHMQMKWLNNKRLSAYFSRIINIQQKLFQREIRRSQETILKCYEKMLLSYKNADKVALIISQRTSLTAEEVIEIISQCLLVEAASGSEKELKKSQNESIQKVGTEEAFQSPKAFSNSDNSDNSDLINGNFEGLHLRKMIQETNHLLPPSHFFKSGKNPELCQGVTTESVLIERIPGRENSKIPSQNPSGRVTGILHPQRQTLRVEHEELKSDFIQMEDIQKLQSQNALKNSKIRQSQQIQCQHLPSNSHPKNGLAHPNQRLILSYPGSGCPTNFSPFQQGNHFTVPGPPIRNTELSFSGQFINCSSKNSTANQNNPSNSDISNSESRFLIRMIAQNTVQCDVLPHQSNALNGAFPSGAYNGLINSSRQIPPINLTQCPLKVTVVNSERLPNQNFVNFLPNQLVLPFGGMAESRSRVEKNAETESRNVSSRVPDDSLVLDPTVPKKLTMKNWRLQAGPNLNFETQREKVTKIKDKPNLCESLKEEKHVCHKLGNPVQEDSKERKYICAQNDCKNQGVRICKGCQSIIYCSTACQLKHWAQQHMVECNQLQKLRS